MERTKHTRWLQAAFKHIHTCAICSKKPTGRKWGVVLCESCEEQWMFGLTPNPAVKAALELTWAEVKHLGVLPHIGVVTL